MTRRNKVLPIFAHNLTAYTDCAVARGTRRYEIAAKANMSKGQFSDLLNGKNAAPSVWTAKRLADVLGVTVDDLLTTDPDHRRGIEAQILERLFATNEAA